MTSQQIQQIYRSRMQVVLDKIAKEKQVQLDKERDEQIKTQENNAKVSLMLTGIGMGQDLRDRFLSSKLRQEYGGPDEAIAGILPKRFEYKPEEETTFLERIFDPLQEKEAYKEFKAIEETGVDPESLAGWINPETGKQGTAQEYARLVKQRQLPETPTAYPTYLLRPQFLLPPVPDVPVGQSLTEEEYYTGVSYDPSMDPDIDTGVSYDPSMEPIPSDPEVAKEYLLEKSQAEAEVGTKRIRDMVDPLSDEFDPSQITPTKGMPEHVPYASGAEGAPISPEVEIPDAKPGLVGKTFKAGQTVMQLTNIGKTIADERATDEQKGVASVQGAKLLADLATTRAGQETVSQIGGKAATKFLTGKGLKEGVKLTGKQAVGTVLGGVLGAHTAVTEAKEVGVSWKEEDYDEAILHGIGSASGALQTGGAGMMATGIGAPLGAVLYRVGVAGSLISSAGLFLEGLFGDGGKQVKPEKQKFNTGRYLDSIRSSRRYY